MGSILDNRESFRPYPGSQWSDVFALVVGPRVLRYRLGSSRNFLAESSSNLSNTLIDVSCTSNFSPTEGFSTFFLKGKGTFVNCGGGLGGNEIGRIVGGTGSSSSPSSGESDVSVRLASLLSSGDLEACRLRGVETMNPCLKIPEITVAVKKEM